MGQLIMTVVGGFVGGLIGGPMGAKLGMMLGGMLGSALFGPTIKGPRLTDLKVTASTLGQAIPECYGTVRLATNVIWSTGIKEKKNKSGGLGKGAPKQTTYTYDATFAAALCKGPINSVLRIWADSKLIFDASANATRYGLASDSNYEIITGLETPGQKGVKAKKKKTFNLRIYKGTEDQLPDSLMEADKGVGNVSAHRGIAYLVFEKMQLADFGNRIPSITVEITKTTGGWFPSIIAKDSDENNYPGNNCFPDWYNGRYYSDNGDSTKIGNLDTMKLTGSGPRFGIYGRNVWMPEIDVVMSDAPNGGSNSRPLRFWNMTSLTPMYDMGKEGGRVFGEFLSENGDYTEQYGALGTSGGNTVQTPSGAATFIVTTNWTGTTWIFRLGDRIPVAQTGADFGPNAMFAGKSTSSGCDIIGWRNGAGTIQLQIWSLSSGSAGHVQDVPPPRNRIWIQGAYGKQLVTLNPFAGEGGGVEAHICLYDPTDDTVFVTGFKQMPVTGERIPCSFKYGVTTGVYKFVKVYESNFPWPSGMQFSRLDGGTFGWFRYNGFYTLSTFMQISLQTGEQTERNDIPDGTFARSFANGNQNWDDVSSSIVITIGDGGPFRRIYFRAGGGGVSVADIVTDVCLKTGVLGISDIDISQLHDDKVAGYLIDRETSARDVLKQMGTAYLFDGYESDYKLKFKSRGNNPIVTIPANWVGRDSDSVVVKETITQELEMPMRINVQFYDVGRDHQQGSQSAKRNASPAPTMFSKKEDNVELPVSWTATEAKRCAEKLLKMSWANRWSYGFTLPWKYLKYDPTDVAVVNLDDGTTYTMRFVEATIGADFTIDIKAASEKVAAYTSVAVAGPSDAVPYQSIGEAYPAITLVINTPLLRDESYDSSGNSSVYLTAATKNVFDGAYIYVNEGGPDYKVVAYAEPPVVYGYCNTVLPTTTSYESTDEDTVIKIILYDKEVELESVTQEEMLTGYENAALIGEEVIQFRDAVQQESGEWWLTGILRARRGTNYAVGNHNVGERFVLLTEEALAVYTRSPEQYVTTRRFKAVGSGEIIDDVQTIYADLIPRDLMPWTPENVEITDDGTTVKITMDRRSRIVAPLYNEGDMIHYREGDKASAKIAYSLWRDFDLTNMTTGEAADKTGYTLLFDTAGADVPIEITFPLSDLAGDDKFLFKCYETGFTDGIPKWVAFERLGEDRWNLTEAY